LAENPNVNTGLIRRQVGQPASARECETASKREQEKEREREREKKKEKRKDKERERSGKEEWRATGSAREVELS